MDPEFLLKDMWLRYERLFTLAFMFIPTRQGWRLYQNDQTDVSRKINNLKYEIKGRDSSKMSEAFFKYETFLAEYMILIADIEVGIVNWNKFRLAAFRVKDIKEVHQYLMYVQLKQLK